MRTRPDGYKLKESLSIVTVGEAWGQIFHRSDALLFLGLRPDSSCLATGENMSVHHTDIEKVSLGKFFHPECFFTRERPEEAKMFPGRLPFWPKRDVWDLMSSGRVNAFVADWRHTLRQVSRDLDYFNAFKEQCLDRYGFEPKFELIPEEKTRFNRVVHV